MKKICFILLLCTSFNNQSVVCQQLELSPAILQLDSLKQQIQTRITERDWGKAHEILNLAEKMSLDHFGRESAMYGTCLKSRGIILFSEGDLPGAEQSYLESLNILEKTLGKEHSEYSACLNNLAVLYKELGSYEKAESLCLEEQLICKKIFGKENQNYANSLTNLANLYIDMGNYEKAETLHLEAKVIREKTFGKEHPDYASSLNNLGVLYTNMGVFDKSEMYHLEAMAIRAKALGKEHPDYINSLTNLAILYNERGYYEKSKTLNLEVMGITEKIYGKQHQYYSDCLSSLANLYREMGNYEDAEPLHIEAKSIREKVFGKNHPKYTTSLINLANLYVVMGHFEEAEALYLEALTIDAKTLGKSHPFYATDLNNLAFLYKEIGNFDKAEKLHIEAKEIREKSFGKESLYYAESLDHLGILNRTLGNYKKAEPLFLESKSILEKVLGNQHPQYAWSLSNLAALYFSEGNYEKAEPLFLQSLAIFEKANGKNHPDYAVNLGNLSDLYAARSNYDKAEPLLLESLSILEKTLGKTHPSYVENLDHLIVLYEHTKKFLQAESLLIEKTELDNKMLVKACTYLSENELGKYIASFNDDGNLLSSYLFSLSSESSYRNESILPALIFNHSLFHKGFLLNSAARIQAMSNSTTQSNEQIKLLRSYRRQLANEYVKPLLERRNVIELEEKANVAEKELIRTVSGYSEAIQFVHWKEVQSALKNGEAAIEFVKFNVRFPQKSDSIMYSALLLNANTEMPFFIPLFEEKQLNNLLQNDKSKYPANHIEELYASRGINPLSPQKLTDLYSLVWKPLEPYLNGISRIYFSPSGKLHQTNFSAIPVQSEKCLADKYDLIMVGSTRQIVLQDKFTNTTNDAVLFGGLQYDTNATADTKENSLLEEKNSFALQQVLASRGEYHRGSSWNYLPGTKSEVDEISRLLINKDYAVHIYVDQSGTEERFKEIGKHEPSPRILHLATHGFFFPDADIRTLKEGNSGEESVFRQSDNPMIRSGLLLSGANLAWGTGSQKHPGTEDGILTAYEINQMNLSNTELVVLSACETGLGDIQGNEGVYGLQRAFKIAGAKYVIMSLWQVPDKQTSLLMTTFYKKWLGAEGHAKDGNKMTIPNAFHAAQKELRDQGLDPYQWAGFVLVE